MIEDRKINRDKKNYKNVLKDISNFKTLGIFRKISTILHVTIIIIEFF
jgi:hypothetical protein